MNGSNVLIKSRLDRTSSGGLLINWDNASSVEQWWTVVNLLSLLLHGYLSMQAYIDWRVVCGAPDFEHWRRYSAGYYFLGQFGLLLVGLIHLHVGAVSMLLPPPLPEAREQTTNALQLELIVAEIIFMLVAVAFWVARRYLSNHR